MRKCSQQGFSLMELMVVLAIMGVAALIAVPNIVSGLPAYRLKAAGRDMTSQLRKARAIALKDKQNVSISFDETAGRFTCQGQTFPQAGCLTGQYGSGVAYGVGDTGESHAITFPGHPPAVTFTPQGFADNSGFIYLSNARGDVRRVEVTVAGKIAIERWTGSDWE